MLNSSRFRRYTTQEKSQNATPKASGVVGEFDGINTRSTTKKDLVYQALNLNRKLTSMNFEVFS
jgi:hypothetical protein